jgi:hypothetical protein
MYEGLLEIHPESYKDEKGVKMEYEDGVFCATLKNYTGTIVFSETGKILESSAEESTDKSANLLDDSPGNTPKKSTKKATSAAAVGEVSFPQKKTLELDDFDSPIYKKVAGRYSMISLETGSIKRGRESILSNFSDGVPPAQEDGNESEFDDDLDDNFAETQDAFAGLDEYLNQS